MALLHQYNRKAENRGCKRTNRATLQYQEFRKPKNGNTKPNFITIYFLTEDINPTVTLLLHHVECHQGASALCKSPCELSQVKIEVWVAFKQRYDCFDYTSKPREKVEGFRSIKPSGE